MESYPFIFPLKIDSISEEFEFSNLEDQSISSDGKSTFNFDVFGKNFLNNCDFNQVSEEITSNKRTSYIDNPKLGKDILFKITIFPDLEKDINEYIKKMDISKERKIFLFLDENNDYDKIAKIKIDLEPKSNIRNKQKENGIEKCKEKRGRKKKDDHSKRHHNRYSPDNIIKSIKTIINDYLIKFINSQINSLCQKETINRILSELNLSKYTPISNPLELIKKNNYDFRANKTDRKNNLNFLDFTLKNFFSNEIGAKYKSLPIYYNKLIIDKLLEDKDEDNNAIFNFVFEYMTIEDWLNIFLHKQELENIVAKKKSLNDKQINLIKENITKIDDCIIDIYEKDKEYYHCFMLMIYNFRKYYSIKEPRNRKEKIEKNLSNENNTRESKNNEFTSTTTKNIHEN